MYTQAKISTQANGHFGTVGNLELYDHIPPNARKKAEKTGIKSVDTLPDQTTLILKDGKKYYRTQKKR